MSSTDTAKFEEVIASIQSSFSIFSSGGSSIGEGHMISSGISQLEMFDDYFKSVTDGEDEDYEHQGASDQKVEGEQSEDGANTENGSQTEQGQSPGEATSQEDNQSENQADKTDVSVAQAKKALEKAGVSESEQIAEEIEEKLRLHGLQDEVEVEFNANYVMLTINGALLFDSGKAYLSKDAIGIVDNLAAIIAEYDQNVIEIEGHTDNVPMHSGTYENNDVLAFYDINPKAKIHALVITKGMYTDFQDFMEHSSDKEISDFFRSILTVVNMLGLKEEGYRLVMNTGKNSGQEVPHLHAHILGGEPLTTHTL